MTTSTPKIQEADGPETEAALIETRQLEVTYHHVSVAIQGVSLVVPAGSITAVLGSNGAGKTTTMRAITGFLPSDNAAVSQGQVFFDGVDVTEQSPHTRARAGIALVPERDKVFQTLTVEENLRAVAAVGGSAAQREMLDFVHDLFPVLGARLKQVAGYLSGGERQMLGIGRALMLQPRVLVADELSLGIAPVLVDKMMLSLRRLNEERGITVLLVEQNITAALGVADYAYLMENGRVVLAGTPDVLEKHEDVREFYMGFGSGGDLKSYAEVKQYRRKRRWGG